MKNSLMWSVDSDIRNWLPRLQAHRGYWVGGLQQNSLASIKTAFEMGFEMAEFDVRITSDQQLILFHDDYFSGKFIRKTTLASLRSQIQVTTLEELLKWFSGTQNFKLNLEIKSKTLVGSLMEEKICELIRKYSLSGRILISSFNPLSLFRVKKFAPEIYRALLLTFNNEEGNNWFVTSMMMNVFCKPHALHLRFEDYSEVFDRINLSVPVVLWTVNDMHFYKKYQNNIHGIISDEITPETFAATN